MAFDVITSQCQIARITSKTLVTFTTTIIIKLEVPRPSSGVTIGLLIGNVFCMAIASTRKTC